MKMGEYDTEHYVRYYLAQRLCFTVLQFISIIYQNEKTVAGVIFYLHWKNQVDQFYFLYIGIT